MTGRCFLVLLVPYVIVLAILAVIVYFDSSEVDGIHFAIDTMTLRGRLGDPKDASPLLKIAEDGASLFVFVILGFGLAFHITTIEAILKRKEIDQTKKDYEKEKLQHPQLKSFREWLQERDPVMYRDLYGPSEDKPTLKRFRDWLMERELRE